MIQNSDGVATVRARLPWVDDGDDWHKAEVADLYVRAAQAWLHGLGLVLSLVRRFA